MKYLIFMTLLSLLSCTPAGETSNPVKSVAGDNTNTTPTTPQSAIDSFASDGDPLAPYAWHLGNVGQSGFSTGRGKSGEDLKIKEAHALGYTGNGVKIAISDTGLDIYHSDLQAGLLPLSEQRSYVSNTPSQWHGKSPYPQGEAHGTAVTGLIAATAGNEIGSRGVAPEAQFAGFLYLGSFHTSQSSYEAKSLDQMTGDFDIFNYSYGRAGCSFSSPTLSVVNAYRDGVFNLRSGKGALYVKSSGNDYYGYNSDCVSGDNSYFFGNSNTDDDNGLPYLIITSAVNANGVASSYSSPGSNVWIASAGGEYATSSPAMITTDISGCTTGMSKYGATRNSFEGGGHALNRNCHFTSSMNGTSSAAPTLSGVIALILEANPSLTWRDVKHILAMTADKIKDSTAAINHPAGWNLSGYVYDYLYTQNAVGIKFSNTYGFGRVNARAAVEMAQSYTFPLGTYQETINPNRDYTSWYYTSPALNLSIPDRSATGVTNSINVKHNYQIESVQISVTALHSYVGDLGIQITSPSGTTSRVLTVNNNINDSDLMGHLFLSNAFYGEQSAGNWTIKIVDGMTGDTGYLYNWSININGHKITSSAASPTPVSAITHNATNSSTTSSPSVSFTASPSSDVLRYEVSIGQTPGGSETAKWYSIGNATTFTTTGLTLVSGQTYYLNIRAVSVNEKESTVETSSWVVN